MVALEVKHQQTTVTDKTSQENIIHQKQLQSDKNQKQYRNNHTS